MNTAILECFHEGWCYKAYSHDEYVLLFAREPLVDFKTEEEVIKFIDECTAEFKSRTKNLDLHLTGCSRCSRTVSGVQLSPCKTGAAIILNARSIAQEIAKIKADIIKERRRKNAAVLE